mmetsp:Transcript_37810/g.84326  ORF Transcript_37810/g.84326 Transcript_37810/m.84326 type:complete len:278 (+) Transcript_37810:1330-2163(+)
MLLRGCQHHLRQKLHGHVLLILLPHHHAARLHGGRVHVVHVPMLTRPCMAGGHVVVHVRPLSGQYKGHVAVVCHAGQTVRAAGTSGLLCGRHTLLAVPALLVLVLLLVVVMVVVLLVLRGGCVLHGAISHTSPSRHAAQAAHHMELSALLGMHRGRGGQGHAHLMTAAASLPTGHGARVAVRHVQWLMRHAMGVHVGVGHVRPVHHLRVCGAPPGIGVLRYWCVLGVHHRVGHRVVEGRAGVVGSLWVVRLARAHVYCARVAGGRRQAGTSCSLICL